MRVKLTNRRGKQPRGNDNFESLLPYFRRRNAKGTRRVFGINEPALEN